MTGNDVTWPHVTGSGPEVTSFDRKSRQTGCRRPKTPVYCTLNFLQRCNSQEEAAAWQEITSWDLMWPEVTRNWRHLTGAHLEVSVEGQKLPHTVHFTSYKAVARSIGGHVTKSDVTSFQVTGSDPEVTLFDRKLPGSGCRRPKAPVYCTFHFLQGCNSQEEAVMRQEKTSRDLRWPEVTRKWRHFIGSHQEVAVENQKLPYTVHFTSYNAVARRRRQSRDRKRRHVTSGDRKWPKTNVIRKNSPGSGWRSPKTPVYCTFHFIQSCISHKEAVTWQEMTSLCFR